MNGKQKADHLFLVDYLNLKYNMLVIFDKIAHRVFLYSKIIHRNLFGKGRYVEDAKIQTLFIISLSQAVYLFLIIFRFILIKFFEKSMPLYISLSGLFLLCVFNYMRYYKNNRLEEMENSESLFFKNSIMTYTIVIIYFLLAILLFFKIGDIARNLG